jgi:hypothetical protein
MKVLNDVWWQPFPMPEITSLLKDDMAFYDSIASHSRAATLDGQSKEHDAGSL